MNIRVEIALMLAKGILGDWSFNGEESIPLNNLGRRAIAGLRLPFLGLAMAYCLHSSKTCGLPSLLFYAPP